MFASRYITLLQSGEHCLVLIYGLSQLIRGDRGRDDGLGRPSLRTGQADFPHPALQLVVGLRRRSADAAIDLSGLFNG